MGQNIVIKPNKDGVAEQPKIDFVGSDVSASGITLKVLGDSGLSFEGTSGQLFSINNNLSTGKIFSVNDISGIPSIDVDADGTVRLAPFNGTVYSNTLKSYGPISGSGAGNSLTIAAGSGITSGAGGNLILQAGLQAATGGDGKVVVKQVAGQTSNLQEWQNSAGTALATVDAAGKIRTNTLSTFPVSSGQPNDLIISVGAGDGLYKGADIFITPGVPSNLGYRGNVIVSGSCNTATIGPLVVKSDASNTIGVALALDATAVSGKSYSFISTGSGASGGAGDFAVYQSTYVFRVNSSGKYIAGSNQYTYLAQISAYPVDASTKGIVIRGAASQTANLQEWQNSSGTALATVDAAGNIASTALSATPVTSGAGNSLTIAAGNGVGAFRGGDIILNPGVQGSSGGDGNITGTGNIVISKLAPSIMLVDTAVGPNGIGFSSSGQIGQFFHNGSNAFQLGGDARIAFPSNADDNSARVMMRSQATYQGVLNLVKFSASQTADILSIKDHNFTTFSVISASGAFGIGTASPGARTHIVTTAAVKGLIVQAAASQTANLQEWQNSSGTALATVDAAGNFNSVGSLSFPSATTNVAASVNDLALPASAFQRINCTTASSITGIAPPSGGTHVDGRMMRAYNTGTAALTLTHNSGSSTAANRFFNSTGADIVLGANDYAEGIYDSTSNGSGAAGWRLS